MTIRDKPDVILVGELHRADEFLKLQESDIVEFLDAIQFYENQTKAHAWLIKKEKPRFVFLEYDECDLDAWNSCYKLLSAHPKFASEASDNGMDWNSYYHIAEKFVAADAVHAELVAMDEAFVREAVWKLERTKKSGHLPIDEEFHYLTMPYREERWAHQMTKAIKSNRGHEVSDLAFLGDKHCSENSKLLERLHEYEISYSVLHPYELIRRYDAYQGSWLTKLSRFLRPS